MLRLRKNEFNPYLWNAPFIQDPLILREYVDTIGLLGARICEITSFSYASTCLGYLGDTNIFAKELCPRKIDKEDMFKNVQTEDESKFIEQVYDMLVKEEQLKIVPLRLEYYDPIVIFTDQGAFEFDYTESSTIRLSKDAIPSHFYYPNNGFCIADALSFDIRKVFSRAAGKKIVGYDIKEQDYSAADDQYTGSYGIGLNEAQESYILEFRLILDSGDQLAFASDYDNGYLTILDKTGACVQVNNRDAVQYLKDRVNFYEILR